MGIFGSKKIEITDSNFGKIESFHLRGNDVIWKFERNFMGTNVEILIDGNKSGIFEKQKQILLNALNNEAKIESEAEKALKEQYNNADIEFISIIKHFDFSGVALNNNGFELSFEQKEGQNYLFNVHFENSKCVGVSIDG